MTDDKGEKAKPARGTKGKDVHSVKLSRDIQAQLGGQLRQMYNDVVSQGVPDKFADLLAKLEKPGESEKSPK